MAKCRAKGNEQNEQSFKYEVHTAHPVPENWKQFMYNQGVTKIVDGYCPPDCGVITGVVNGN